MTPVRKNGQTVAVGSMTVAAGTVTFLVHKLGWTLPDYYAVFIAGAVMTVLSWIGHRGLRGIWNAILNGTGGSRDAGK